jgi:hypothetical protein
MRQFFDLSEDAYARYVRERRAEVAAQAALAAQAAVDEQRAWLDSIRGPQGPQGEPGPQGPPGKSAPVALRSEYTIDADGKITGVLDFMDDDSIQHRTVETDADGHPVALTLDA